MNTLAKVLIRRLVRTGVKRGLVDGSRFWIYVGGLSWIARMLLKPKRPAVRRETLAPGETLVVSNVRDTHRFQNSLKKARHSE